RPAPIRLHRQPDEDSFRRNVIRTRFTFHVSERQTPVNPIEVQIRQELGIPDPTIAKQVILLCSTAHLDWDWLNTFLGYYSTTNNYDGYDVHAVRMIFQNATQYLAANSQPPYYYSIAEIGYLKQFAADQPASFATLQGVGGLLRIVGGGV